MTPHAFSILPCVVPGTPSAWAAQEPVSVPLGLHPWVLVFGPVFAVPVHESVLASGSSRAGTLGTWGLGYTGP